LRWSGDRSLCGLSIIDDFDVPPKSWGIVVSVGKILNVVRYSGCVDVVWAVLNTYQKGFEW
jgi:hypothetical protein